MRVCRHKVDGLAEQGLNLPQDLLERCLKVLRQRTEHDLVALANQQRIIEQHPEFIQRVADGRLTQMQTDACTGHVFFRQQRIEHYQQIQIDIAQ